MHLTYRNVNDAFRGLVSHFHAGVLRPHKTSTVSRQQSRNGNVMVIDEPVTITYQRPLERVLFNQARDANPFALLYEALWMLAGRNDVDSLAYYTKQFREYSDNGVSLNGAYGYRWRSAKVLSKWREFPDYTQIGQTVNQLDILVDHLKANPNSRRAVLAMWNVEDDLLKIGGLRTEEYEDYSTCPEGLTRDRPVPGSKDVCCNLNVMFSLRTPASGLELEGAPKGLHHALHTYLDMTVTNRSNDLIWGLLGANYVCFTVLQEYMAARLGVGVGMYHHFTNNLHVYDWNWKPKEWLAWYDRPVAVRSDWYEGEKRVPLVENPAVFDREVRDFCGAFNGEEEPWLCVGEYKEPFLQTVAGMALTAYRCHKKGKCEEALRWCKAIAADDWRIACTNWLERRYKKEMANG